MVVSGHGIVVVARVESPDVLGFSVRVGYRRPLNQSAAGRVLYASQDEAERAAWCVLLSSKEDQERWEIKISLSQAAIETREAAQRISWELA